MPIEPDSYYGNSFDLARAMAEVAPRIRAGEVEPTPVFPTGILALDRAWHGGIPLGKLTLIAARTSHGKTANAVRLAANFSDAGHKVRVLWAEDDAEDFTIRLSALLARIPLEDVYSEFHRGNYDSVFHRIEEASHERWRRIRIEKAERPSVAEAMDLIEGMARKEILVVDHLGEVEWESGPKHETIGRGVRDLRNVARKRGVLIVAMTQLNRDWDRRRAAAIAAGGDPDKVRPVLSDIENSGQLEQVARYCAIAEKLPNACYAYHVFKPALALAECVWDESSCTPDNPVPVPVATTVQPALRL